MNGILCYLSQVGDLLTGRIAPKALASVLGRRGGKDMVPAENLQENENLLNRLTCTYTSWYPNFKKYQHQSIFTMSNQSIPTEHQETYEALMAEKKALIGKVQRAVADMVLFIVLSLGSGSRARLVERRWGWCQRGCSSCNDVIKQFQSVFPNIKFIIAHGIIDPK